jgi:hypothetical protein
MQLPWTLRSKMEEKTSLEAWLSKVKAMAKQCLNLQAWLSKVKAMSKQCKSESTGNLNLEAWLSEVSVAKPLCNFQEII